jgi:hypothetical protein
MIAPLYVLPDAPARLVKVDLVRRAQAVDFLRTIARAIEEGSIAADAVVIVTSWGDVHDVTWSGYQSAAVLSAATGAAHDAYWAAQTGREYDPDYAAYLRLANRQLRAEEVAKAQAEKPWVCECGDRFRTERGRDAHVRNPPRWRWKKTHGPAQDQPPTLLEAVDEDAGE